MPLRPSRPSSHSSGAQTGHVLAALSLGQFLSVSFRVLDFWSSCVLCNLPFHLLLHQLSLPLSNMLLISFLFSVTICPFPEAVIWFFSNLPASFHDIWLCGSQPFPI